MDAHRIDRKQYRGNPLDILDAARERVVHVHCKDVRNAVLKEVKAADTSFLDSIVRGVFTVPGNGDIDFSSIVKRLLSVRQTAAYETESAR